jgi:hypothetical protein
MKRRSTPRWLVLPLLAIAAIATTVKPMSIERLTRASSDIVLAHAEAQWTEWNAKRTMLHTYTRFRVGRALKGGKSATLVVRQMGGRADGIEQKVSGVRTWRVGEEAVLFLRPSKEQPGTHVVTGLMQGDFRIQRERGEAYVNNGVAGVEIVAEGKTQPYQGARLTLGELERRVRAVSKSGARTR